jgi:hypothetical protein
VFENGVLKRIYEPSKEEAIGRGRWRKLHNEELCNLCSLDIMRMMKYRPLRWEGHVESRVEVKTSAEF